MTSSISETRAFWEESAKNERNEKGLRPVAPDPQLQDLIESRIEQHLSDNQRLLDIGCGDGLSTIRFARTTREVVGVDYVPGFVQRSEKNAADHGVTNAVFEQGNVLDLSNIVERYGRFDVVVSIRCLINLPSWADQRAAVKEIANVVAPKGLFLCAEGWTDGIDGLNRLRARLELEPISPVKHNVFMKRDKFKAEAEKYFSLEKYFDLGTYLLLSRVFHPLLVAPEPPQHESRINQVAQKLQDNSEGMLDGESFDYAGLYALRRLP